MRYNCVALDTVIHELSDIGYYSGVSPWPHELLQKVFQEEVHLRVKTMNSQVTWYKFTLREARP